MNEAPDFTDLLPPAPKPVPDDVVEFLHSRMPWAPVIATDPQTGEPFPGRAPILTED